MARQWRIEYPGAIYHVLSQGNNRQDIFQTTDGRHLFLGLLEEFRTRFNISLYAYVLMSNHYHPLLQTHEGNLSKSMQWLGTTYTRRYNLNNRQSGHLFQGRFKSIIVEDETYLLQLACYIHRNPLRAGVINRLADYPWNSYRYYGYAKRPPQWLDTDLILRLFCGKNPHQAYRMKTQRYSEEEGRIWEDVKHGLVYGSRDFVRKIRDQFLTPEKMPNCPSATVCFLTFHPKRLLSRHVILWILIWKSRVKPGEWFHQIKTRGILSCICCGT